MALMLAQDLTICAVPDAVRGWNDIYADDSRSIDSECAFKLTQAVTIRHLASSKGGYVGFPVKSEQLQTS